MRADSAGEHDRVESAQGAKLGHFELEFSTYDPRLGEWRVP